MPAKDLFHDTVKLALVRDGWTITHDPLFLDYGDVQMQIDLGAERLIAAERANDKIAIEVKSFTAPSAISEFHKAVGQFMNYRRALRVLESDRRLYLAVPDRTYRDFFRLRFIQEGIEEYQLKIVVYNVEQEGIVQWIN